MRPEFSDFFNLQVSRVLVFKTPYKATWFLYSGCTHDSNMPFLSHSLITGFLTPTPQSPAPHLTFSHALLPPHALCPSAPHRTRCPARRWACLCWQQAPPLAQLWAHLCWGPSSKAWSTCSVSQKPCLLPLHLACLPACRLASLLAIASAAHICLKGVRCRPVQYV